MKTLLWIGAGAAAVGAVIYFLTRQSCSRCQKLAQAGEFDEIAGTFDEVCKECVEVGMEHSLPALEAKMDACNSNPTPECQEELSRYWHNLFLMGKKAGNHREVSQNFINMTAAADPTLARYRSSGYTAETTP